MKACVSSPAPPNPANGNGTAPVQETFFQFTGYMRAISVPKSKFPPSQDETARAKFLNHKTLIVQPVSKKGESILVRSHLPD
jgi:hypothetical protein